jgi:hypothetical protein
MTHAQAGSSTTSCTDPVQRADGSPFDAATALDHYNWYINDVKVFESLSCNPFALVDPNPPAGQSTYTAPVTATTVDKLGLESIKATTKIKTFTVAAPEPPVIN